MNYRWIERHYRIDADKLTTRRAGWTGEKICRLSNLRGAEGVRDSGDISATRSALRLRSCAP
jgi:hypothetical protein